MTGLCPILLLICDDGYIEFSHSHGVVFYDAPIIDGYNLFKCLSEKSWFTKDVEDKVHTALLNRA